MIRYLLATLFGIAAIAILLTAGESVQKNTAAIICMLSGMSFHLTQLIEDKLAR